MAKEVRYDIYCSYCKNASRAAAEDPCDECLSNPANDGTHKPKLFDKEYPMIQYLTPDPNVANYTVDRFKSMYWKDHSPSVPELKAYFVKEDGEAGDWIERWDVHPPIDEPDEEEEG